MSKRLKKDPMDKVPDDKYGWIGTDKKIKQPKVGDWDMESKPVKTVSTSRRNGVQSVHTPGSKGRNTPGSNGGHPGSDGQNEEEPDKMSSRNARALKKRTFYIDPECSREIKILSATLGIHEYVLMNEALGDLLVKYRTKKAKNATKNRTKEPELNPSK